MGKDKPVYRPWEAEGLTPRERAKSFYEELLVVKNDGKDGWASDIDFIEELFVDKQCQDYLPDFEEIRDIIGFSDTEYWKYKPCKLEDIAKAIHKRISLKEDK